MVTDKDHYIYKVAFTAEDGDLTVVITGGDARSTDVCLHDKRTALTVQSSKLDEALPGWKDLIVETKNPRSFEHLPVAELAIGTSLVLQHLIMLAHHTPADQGSENDSAAPVFIIEAYLDRCKLRELCILSHQFNALHLIAGNIWKYVHMEFPLSWRPNMSGDEDDHVLDFLWMSYEFGFHKMFRDVWYVVSIIPQADNSGVLT